MNAADLYDALSAALHRTRWRVSRPFRFHRHAIWLTGPTVEIRDAHGTVQRWHADISDHRGHGFTRRQARQIRAALLDVMRTQAADLEARILAMVRHEQSE